MTQPPKPPQDVFTDEASCDMSRAVYAPQLSLVARDAATDAFVATIDKVLFRRPVDVVTTILEANGFIVNLENILACLDQFHIGVRTKPLPPRADGAPPTVKDFLPCVQVGLPDKNRVGDLLRKFYDEIAAYEMALARLQGDGPAKDAKKDEAAELRAEVARLRQENHNLKEQAALYRARVRELEQAEARMHRAFEEQDKIPENVRLGVVKAVHMTERAVEVKAGRAKLSVPLTLVAAVPRPGATALVALRQGQVAGALFFDGEETPFEECEGHVLAKALHTVKVRDAARRVWVLAAANRQEESLFARLARKDKVLLSLHEGKVVKVRPLHAVDQDVFGDRVRESLVKTQLKGQRHEAHAVEEPPRGRQKGVA